MRTLILAGVATAALVIAGAAIAHAVANGKAAQSVAGTFTATTASSKNRTTTCTTSTGRTIAVTKGTYTGTAAGSSALAGAIRLDVHATVNTTDDVGVVRGRLRIDVPTGADTVAQFSAVYEKGKLAGLASGHAESPHAKLLANLSAGFNAATGFTDGKLGATAGGAAVLIGRPGCGRDDDTSRSEDKSKEKKGNKDDD